MFRLRMTVDCFVLSARLLITSSAFAQIELPGANQSTVQQLQREIDDLREEIHLRRSEERIATAILVKF